MNCLCDFSVRSTATILYTDLPVNIELLLSFTSFMFTRLPAFQYLLLFSSMCRLLPSFCTSSVFVGYVCPCQSKFAFSNRIKLSLVVGIFHWQPPFILSILNFLLISWISSLLSAILLRADAPIFRRDRVEHCWPTRQNIGALGRVHKDCHRTSGEWN